MTIINAHREVRTPEGRVTVEQYAGSAEKAPAWAPAHTVRVDGNPVQPFAAPRMVTSLDTCTAYYNEGPCIHCGPDSWS